MITREELIKSKEYWLEKIQNSLFAELEDYIEDNNLNKTKFAKKLGVSKGYLSQVLNGNFDHKISKLVELSLAIDKVPIVKFEEIEKCLKLDKVNKLSLTDSYNVNVNVNVGYKIRKRDLHDHRPSWARKEGNESLVIKSNDSKQYNQYSILV